MTHRPEERGGGGRRPWVALAMPPMAWMLFEYGLGSAMGNACTAVGSWMGPLWGALSLIVCAAAAVLARSAAKGSGEDARTRPWLSNVALLGSGVFALAIAFQTLATLIVPSCAR